MNYSSAASQCFFSSLYHMHRDVTGTVIQTFARATYTLYLFWISLYVFNFFHCHCVDECCIHFLFVTCHLFFPARPFFFFLSVCLSLGRGRARLCCAAPWWFVAFPTPSLPPSALTFVSAGDFFLLVLAACFLETFFFLRSPSNTVGGVVVGCCFVSCFFLRGGGGSDEPSACFLVLF